MITIPNLFLQPLQSLNSIIASVRSLKFLISPSLFSLVGEVDDFGEPETVSSVASQSKIVNSSSRYFFSCT